MALPYLLPSTAIVDGTQSSETLAVRSDASGYGTQSSETLSFASAYGTQSSETLASDAVASDETKLDEVGQSSWIQSHLSKLEKEGIAIKRAGFSFKNLWVSGNQSWLGLQADVGSILTLPLRPWEYLKFNPKPPRAILSGFNGAVAPGEMLLVLGRPGAGCSTFLKSIAGELQGLSIDQKSMIHYNGISQEQMRKEFRGEILYNQEIDTHFPHLTVNQTLDFAAQCRTPRTRVSNMSREQYASMVRDLVINVFGLEGARNTKVGNEFVRGASGGERKRVSIAEMAIAGAPLGCWDNSTRGLDSGSALTFARALRLSCNLTSAAHAVAIYQASKSVYDLFDKVTLLYEGKQVYFGPASRARSFFEEMGWLCYPRQTTSDFLTGLTNPTERKARPGYEDKVPRSAEDFAAYWERSEDYRMLQHVLGQQAGEFSFEESAVKNFQTVRRADRANIAPKSSPYTASIPEQIRLCTVRAYQRVRNDTSSTVSLLVGQIIMALIMGSLFYGQSNGTQSFFTRGGVLFFTITINALLAITEINGLYEQRPIVAKHASYAFCAPFAEAIASVLADLPVKFLANLAFNVVLYFLVGLRQTPAAFFVFLLFNFVVTVAMSLIFRTVAASTKTIAQAMVIAGVLVMALVIYAGFTPPVPSMHPWFSWITYINPVAYAFESLVLNEFHGQDFPCSELVPNYPGFQYNQTDMPYFICTVLGGVAGQLYVSGDAFVESSFQYTYDHMWRNLGILLGMIVFLFTLLVCVTQFVSVGPPAPELLIFRRKNKAELMKRNEGGSILELEAGQEGSAPDVNTIAPQKEVFAWRGVTYDITVKKESRRLLSDVGGWVRPGSLTALMGVSGAGKTTLLDALAQRTRKGSLTGDVQLGDHSARLLKSFQRRTGYVQQQDIHSESNTVREALRFSAILRQPPEVSQEEKFRYVESIISMLNMGLFADAVIGLPGEGLNVKQRKLLSIGVELAAKPALLFLDEPTSGLDTQSSWAVVSLLRELANLGQTILCTIHQPSSILFEQFDRLLFLAKGGRTAYFGPIGENSRELIKYFEENGARKCAETENAAEYMIEIASGSNHDWPQIWNEDYRSKQVSDETDRIFGSTGAQEKSSSTPSAGRSTETLYAMPFWTQLWLVTFRLFQQYWRTPSYVLGKAMLGVFASLFISFSFYGVDSSRQGLQNAIFSIFMLLSTFTVVVQQIMPQFIAQRTLYEIRERPSRAYSWIVFLIANIVVELSYQASFIVAAFTFASITVFGCWFYPIFGVLPSLSQGYILLVIFQFYLFGSTFAHLLAASLPDAQTAGNVATFLFTLIVAFNGVFVPPTALPGFWIFLYRLSPLTYIVDAISAASLHGRVATCTSNELSVFQPPPGQDCGGYLEDFMTIAPGQLLNPSASQDCEYCSIATSDQFLASYNINYQDLWLYFGIVWSYVGFNIIMTFALYYVFRVKKWKKS
ncbi:MAG: hypothetical protein M1837_003026 [Sclerophora amabilis]|nr:MAG: hypothetical protein M1837_003026 [Sclerophora amabilis]